VASSRRRAGIVRRFAARILLIALCAYLAVAASLVSLHWIPLFTTAVQAQRRVEALFARKPYQKRYEFVRLNRIAPDLQHAVIASEDSGFTEHSGVEWDALEKAWAKNERAETVAEHAAERAAAKPSASARPTPAPKVVGGSTITQQLAKNLFLSGERNLVRKGQELILSYALEAILGKRRILEIYLNSVEWGEGVFGAEAAAERYFGVPASRLGAQQAAQLAVMLPAPKRFEKRPQSPYVVGRAATIAARMGHVDLP